jgi:hypothetical protein
LGSIEKRSALLEQIVEVPAADKGTQPKAVAAHSAEDGEAVGARFRGCATEGTFTLPDGTLIRTTRLKKE